MVLFGALGTFNAGGDCGGQGQYDRAAIVARPHTLRQFILGFTATVFGFLRSDCDNRLGAFGSVQAETERGD
jgi:hypothetical protein